MRHNRASKRWIAAAILLAILVLVAYGYRYVTEYVKRSKTTEATMQVRKLFDSSVSYYDAEHQGATPRFPLSVGPTPSLDRIGPEPYGPDPTLWEHPTWRALNFSVDMPSYYAYQYDSAGERLGATFTATAFGDIDGDGVYSVYCRVGEVEQANEIRGGAGLYQGEWDPNASPAPARRGLQAPFN